MYSYKFTFERTEVWHILQSFVYVVLIPIEHAQSLYTNQTKRQEVGVVQQG